MSSKPYSSSHEALEPSDIDTEPNWSNGTDSFDDPSEYRTYRETPPPSSTHGHVPSANDLAKLLGL